MTPPKTHWVERLAALVAIGCVTACSGGDPASPSVEGVSVVAAAADTGANLVDAGVDVATDVAMDIVPPTCPRDEVPDACPSPPPSWLYSARIVVETKCSPCHYPSGADDTQVDYSTYQNVHKGSGPMFANVATCAMPPPDAAALTAMERETLLAWLACGAPDN